MNKLKSIIILIVLQFLLCNLYCQSVKQGSVVVHRFLSPSIKGNKAGEEANRRLTIYLPPGYENSNARYPVIYFLHGYAVNDSLLFKWMDLAALMDKAISSGKIRPVILVLPDSENKYRGSFYTNSSFTGKWADFIAVDVVGFTDKTFRTIADRKSRGLSGHSMGGNGTLKLAMLFPDVFNAIYSMSPGGMSLRDDFNIRHPAFKKISQAQNESEVMNAVEMDDPGGAGFFVNVFGAMGRAFSPDEKKLPVQARMPVEYKGDSMIINDEVIKLWEKQSPVNMVEDHLPALRKYAAIKIDWGRNEQFPHVITTSKEFSKKLEAFGIKHYAEEYLGDHVNMVDERFLNEVLPFFELFLQFSK